MSPAVDKEDERAKGDAGPGTMDSRARGRASVALCALAPAILAALLAWSAPPWPDGWDGLGFLSSIRRFDLASFSPHPPGYPVYVVLLKLAAGVAPKPMHAALLVAVASAIVALVALRGAVLATTAANAAPRAWSGLVPLAVVLCPLVWRSSTAVGSEAPALAFVALALWGMATRSARGAVVAAVMVGLALGVRASWAPLALPLLFLAARGRRLRAGLAAAAATLAWVVPFVLVVGPAQLWSLSRTHLLGHASRWGGTALTEPTRMRYLLRDVFVDGFGVDADVTGICIAVVGLVALALALAAWRRAAFRGAGIAAVVLAPYLAWVAVGQNLRQEPRHTLPLVVAVALGLVASAMTDRRARVAVLALFLLCGVRTALDEAVRRRTPPPGEQLVELVRARPDRDRVMVFGGASARFFEGTDLAARARTVGGVGDAMLVLDRLDRLPAHVLVTSELEDLSDSPYPLVPLATLSRPAWIDRKAPTLVVYDLLAPFLPSR